MAQLILVRHGKSTWNALGKWTGHTDVELTEEGRIEAKRAAEAIRDIELHKAHTSLLKRAHQTFEEIKNALGLHSLEVKTHHALNERDYGVYTGMNKWEVKEKIGDEEFKKLRRGWDVAIPNGESLKDVYERVVPYYESVILPDIGAGYTTLVVAHGNSLRALVKHLEKLDEMQVAELEMGTGEAFCYEMDETGRVIERTIRAANAGKLGV